jgi:hypothetical protein
MDVPFVMCPDTECNTKLVYKPLIRGILYTITHGALPTLCPSVYCHRKRSYFATKFSLMDSVLGCKSRFYHNFKVKSASCPDSFREYYDTSVPQYIEITDHIYVDQGFCKWVRLEIAINAYVNLSHDRNMYANASLTYVTPSVHPVLPLRTYTNHPLPREL